MPVISNPQKIFTRGYRYTFLSATVEGACIAHGCLSGVSEVPVVQKNRSTAGMEAVPQQRDPRRGKKERYLAGLFSCSRFTRPLLLNKLAHSTSTTSIVQIPQPIHSHISPFLQSTTRDTAIMPPSSTTPNPSKPSRYLTLPLLILLLLTLSISVATLVCTTKTLNLFYHPQPASPWQPFDLQLLERIRVTSILITLFDVLIVMVVTGFSFQSSSLPVDLLLPLCPEKTKPPTNTS
jgi:hypothetical protein